MASKTLKEDGKMYTEKPVERKELWKRRVMIFVLIILFLAVSWGIFIFHEIIQDELPPAPEIETNTTQIYAGISLDLLMRQEIALDTNQFNSLLEQFRKKANESLSEQDSKVVIDELFCEIQEDSVVFYIRGKSGLLPLHISGTVQVDYENPQAKFNIKNVKLGAMNIKTKKAIEKLKKQKLPDEISFTQDAVCYDTTAVKDYVLEMIRKNEDISKAEDTLNSLGALFGIDKEIEQLMNFEILNILVQNGEIIIKIKTI